MLTEQYRPKSWADVVGQEKVVAKLQALGQRNRLGGRAYWLSGRTGTGKTTIGRLIAAELAEPWCIHEWDASELTADTMREIERTMRGRGLGERDGRARGVRRAAAGALRQAGADSPQQSPRYGPGHRSR